MPSKSVSELLGAWKGSHLNSSLIEQCKDNWNTPINLVSNHVLAIFIRQNIAPSITLPEARKRIAAGYKDESELYDRELEITFSETSKST